MKGLEGIHKIRSCSRRRAGTSSGRSKIGKSHGSRRAAGSEGGGGHGPMVAEVLVSRGGERNWGQ